MDLTDGIAATFIALDGAGLRLDDSTAKAALVLLAERWPASVGVEPLLRDARRHAGRSGRPTPFERREFAGFLATNHAMGFVDLHTWEPPMATSPGVRPLASALARIEIERGTRVTSLRHRQVEIDDPVAAAALVRLDGTRDRATLHEDLGRASPAGPVALPDIETVLSGLAYHCLLAG